MTLIEFAIKNERWDLAAHIIVLVAARSLKEEVKQNGEKNKEEDGCSER
jgi:hypothetical protein